MRFGPRHCRSESCAYSGWCWARAGGLSARPAPKDHVEERRLRHEATYNALLGAGLWVAWILPVVQARHFLSHDAAGRFGAAAFLATGILFLISPLTTAFYPTIVRTRQVRPIVVGLLATLGLAGACAVGMTAFGSIIERKAYGPGFVVSWQCFFGLGLSVALVAVATYGLGSLAGSSASSGRAPSGSCSPCSPRSCSASSGIPA